MTARDEVVTLYRTLLDHWNARDAPAYGALFVPDGSIVGFDGSCVDSSDAITEHLSSIFGDHQTATYVAKVQEVRALGTDVMLLRGVAGLVPPGAADLAPEMNAVQVLIAVDGAHGWRVAHLQNTPAAFHGRPDDADALTESLRAELRASS